MLGSLADVTAASSGAPWWYFAIPAIAALVSLASALASTLLVYRFTHRHSLRSNAERWLDAVRDDLSNFVALHWMLCTLVLKGAQTGSATIGDRAGTDSSDERTELLKQTREWQRERLALLVRLRLRLTKKGAKHHAQVLDATNKLVRAEEGEEREAAQEKLLEMACDLVRDEWSYISTGRRSSPSTHDYF